MFHRMSRQEKQRRAAKAELTRTMQALRRNENEFNEAQEPFYIEQLTYQHAALPRPAASFAQRRAKRMNLGVYAAAGAVLLVLLRCALAQKRGVRCFLAGSVCGLGALAVLALLQPVTGVALPLTRFTAFVAAVLGVPGVAAVLVLRVILRV